MSISSAQQARPMHVSAHRRSQRSTPFPPLHRKHPAKPRCVSRAERAAAGPCDGAHSSGSLLAVQVTAGPSSSAIPVRDARRARVCRDCSCTVMSVPWLTAAPPLALLPRPLIAAALRAVPSERDARADDFTPVCTTELGTAAKYAGEFEKRGVKMFALSCNGARGVA